MTTLTDLRKVMTETGAQHDLDKRIRRVFEAGVRAGVAEAVATVDALFSVSDPKTGRPCQDAPRSCAPLWVEKVMAELR